MLKKQIVLFLLMIFLLLNGCDDLSGSYSDVKSLSKTLMTRWTLRGAEISDVNNTLDKISLPKKNWSKEWVALAGKYEKQAEELIKERNFDDAKFLLLRASVYYRLAAFPYPFGQEQKDAYKKCLKNFVEANKFFNHPPERVEIMESGKKIIGNFRRPPKNERVPLVILIPGIDSNKEEMYWVEEQFLNKGFATFSLDSPGTGESSWPLRVESEKVFQAVYDHLKKSSYIQRGKIMCVGYDFGGYWAVRLAAKNSDMLGVVCAGGPIHYFFQYAHISKMPNFIQKILKSASGEKDFSDFSKILSKFSLKQNGLLSQLSTPALIINGKDNFLVPIEDTYIFSEVQKGKSVIKVYPKGKYGFPDNLAEVDLLILNWLEELVKKK